MLQIEAGKTYIQLTAETSEAMTGLSLLVKELFFDNKESVVVTNPVLSTTFASTSSAMIVEG